MDRTIGRHARAAVERALVDTPVVVIQGARQVGKSTLADEISRDRGRYVTLDDPGQLAGASTDPTSFVDQLPRGCLVIDEVQRAPDLILAIKASVDRDRRPGRFLLTGSANLLRLPTTHDSLAGRAESVELYGFSQGELEGHRERFIDRVMAGDRMLDHHDELTRGHYLQRVCAGGYPEALTRAGERRSQWYDEYIRRITERDAPELSNLRKLEELPQLVRLLAAHNATEVANSTLARHLRIHENTVPGYLTLLETIYLIQRIPAWSNNLSRRITRRPKTALLDCGLAARLINVDAASLAADLNPAPSGMLVEGWVLSELRKQRCWSDSAPALFHFRDRSGPEVDIVLESADGRVVGIEVKASATLGRHDARWLELLRDRLGRRFVAGVVLYLGTGAHALGDRIAALPLSALWRA